MYIEASSPRKKGDNAMIGSAVFTPTSTCKVRFFYHMYGRHIGTLNVYTRTNTTGPMNKIWTKSGDQGDKWVKATAGISVSKNFQVSISSSGAIRKTCFQSLTNDVDYLVCLFCHLKLIILVITAEMCITRFVYIDTWKNLYHFCWFAISAKLHKSSRF